MLQLGRRSEPENNVLQGTFLTCATHTTVEKFDPMTGPRHRRLKM